LTTQGAGNQVFGTRHPRGVLTLGAHLVHEIVIAHFADAFDLFVGQ